MSPYREVEYTAPPPYRLARPLWFTMLISTVFVVATIGSMVVGSAVLIGAMS